MPKAPRKILKTYNLYTRCAQGDEPKVAVSVDDYIPGTDCVVGQKTVYGEKYGSRRGALIATFNTYKQLVSHAEYLAKVIGMPKSRIWDIFDWNQ